ncbi:MAG: hypothetical protein DCC74_05350 [Proteobacteria bacterium]|nr:MAG: hypothetical protein DCC74_05350 [Pseudomonadota bacterium]
MTRSRLFLSAAAALALASVVAVAPARAQFGGDDTDMMTQFAPMLEMMKAKMGKKRFAKLMQTVGPVMSNMMEGEGGSGSGFGGMTGISGLAGGSFGGGDMLGMMNNPQMIGMLPQLIGLIDMGEPRRKRRR